MSMTPSITIGSVLVASFVGVYAQDGPRNAGGAVPSVERECKTALGVESATRDADVRIRRAAVHLLGAHGSASSIAAVAHLVHDPDDLVRGAAVEAIASMCLRGGDYRAQAAKAISPAVHDQAPGIRERALYALAELDTEAAGEKEDIRASLGDSSPGVQIAAAYALGRIGERDGLDATCSALIAKYAGGSADVALSRVLRYITSAEHTSACAKLLDSSDLSARYAAECAVARIKGMHNETRESGELEALWESEFRNAKRALSSAPRKPVTRSELLQRVRDARVVLCGEMHETGGGLRKNQLEILRAFVTHPECEAVGYEPSVESVQKDILDAAKALGVRTIPVEHNWEKLLAEDRSGARDQECVQVIKEFLSEGPTRRILVLRGEDHVLPSGFLVKRLPVQPVIVLSGVHAWTSLCDVGLVPDDPVFRIECSESTYLVPYQDTYAERDAKLISAWLSEHR